MIVDASAITAILAREPEADILVARLRSAPRRLTHPISVYEAVLAIGRRKDVPIDVATQDVADFLAGADLEIVTLHAEASKAALRTFERYGKGRHPAKLNMGDCSPMPAPSFAACRSSTRARISP